MLGNFVSERIETPPAEALASGEIPVISKIAFDGRIELRASAVSNTDLVLVRPGDLVLSGINALKGACAYVRTDATPVAATIHYSVYRVGEEADSEFVWRLLRTTRARSALSSSRRHGIKSELRPRDVLALAVQLPALAEQRQTNARLRDLDSQAAVAVAAARRSLLQADEAYQATLDAHFEGQPETGRFADVLSVKPRSGPSFLTDPEWQGQPVAMPSAVTGFWFRADRVEYSLQAEQVRDLDRLRPGDILIARGNKKDQVGNAAVVPPEAEGWVGANLLMRTQVDPAHYDPRYFVYWLQSSVTRARVRAATKGTSPSIQKINQAALLALPAPVTLALDEQARVADGLDRLRTQAVLVGQEAERQQQLVVELAESLTDALLAPALSAPS